MSSPWLVLVVLHAVIALTGATTLWAAHRRPRTVVAVSTLLVASGGWALWSAYGAMAAAGPAAGQGLLRLGQWAVAIGLATCALLAAVRRGPPESIEACGWTDWAKALAAHWFVCLVLALIEGVVVFVSTPHHGQFR